MGATLLMKAGMVPVNLLFARLRMRRELEYVVPVVNVPIHPDKNDCNEESKLLFEASNSLVFQPTPGESKPVSVLLPTRLRYFNEVRREKVVRMDPLSLFDATER